MRTRRRARAEESEAPLSDASVQEVGDDDEKTSARQARYSLRTSTLRKASTPLARQKSQSSSSLASEQSTQLDDDEDEQKPSQETSANIESASRTRPDARTTESKRLRRAQRPPSTIGPELHLSSVQTSKEKSSSPVVQRRSLRRQKIEPASQSGDLSEEDHASSGQSPSQNIQVNARSISVESTDNQKGSPDEFPQEQLSRDATPLLDTSTKSSTASPMQDTPMKPLEQSQNSLDNENSHTPTLRSRPRLDVRYHTNRKYKPSTVSSQITLDALSSTKKLKRVDLSRLNSIATVEPSIPVLEASNEYTSLLINKSTTAIENSHDAEMTVNHIESPHNSTTSDNSKNTSYLEPDIDIASQSNSISSLVINSTENTSHTPITSSKILEKCYDIIKEKTLEVQSENTLIHPEPLVMWPTLTTQFDLGGLPSLLRHTPSPSEPIPNKPTSTQSPLIAINSGPTSATFNYNFQSTSQFKWGELPIVEGLFSSIASSTSHRSSESMPALIASYELPLGFVSRSSYSHSHPSLPINFDVEASNVSPLGRSSLSRSASKYNSLASNTANNSPSKAWTNKSQNKSSTTHIVEKKIYDKPEESLSITTSILLPSIGSLLPPLLGRELPPVLKEWLKTTSETPQTSSSITPIKQSSHKMVKRGRSPDSFVENDRNAKVAKRYDDHSHVHQAFAFHHIDVEKGINTLKCLPSSSVPSPLFCTDSFQTISLDSQHFIFGQQDLSNMSSTQASASASLEDIPPLDQWTSNKSRMSFETIMTTNSNAYDTAHFTFAAHLTTSSDLLNEYDDKTLDNDEIQVNVIDMNSENLPLSKICQEGESRDDSLDLMSNEDDHSQNSVEVDVNNESSFVESDTTSSEYVYEALKPNSVRTINHESVHDISKNLRIHSYEIIDASSSDRYRSISPVSDPLTGYDHTEELLDSADYDSEEDPSAFEHSQVYPTHGFIRNEYNSQIITSNQNVYMPSYISNDHDLEDDEADSDGYSSPGAVDLCTSEDEGENDRYHQQGITTDKFTDCDQDDTSDAMSCIEDDTMETPLQSQVAANRISEMEIQQSTTYESTFPPKPDRPITGTIGAVLFGLIDQIDAAVPIHKLPGDNSI